MGCLVLAGPSLMPGGTKEGYDAIEKIVTKVAAQVDDGPCVTYVGPGATPLDEKRPVRPSFPLRNYH